MIKYVLVNPNTPLPASLQIEDSLDEVVKVSALEGLTSSISCHLTCMQIFDIHFSVFNSVHDEEVSNVDMSCPLTRSMTFVSKYNC